MSCTFGRDITSCCFARSPDCSTAASIVAIVMLLLPALACCLGLPSVSRWVCTSADDHRVPEASDDGRAAAEHAVRSELHPRSKGRPSLLELCLRSSLITARHKRRLWPVETVIQTREDGFQGRLIDHAHVQLPRDVLHVLPCLERHRTDCAQGFGETPRFRRQVAGETEVKAQIKMRLTPTSGVPIVVIRSFQLQQKKSSLQFKTLEQVHATARRHAGLGSGSLA